MRTLIPVLILRVLLFYLMCRVEVYLQQVMPYIQPFCSLKSCVILRLESQQLSTLVQSYPHHISPWQSSLKDLQQRT